jgi:hypothetical protein
MIITQDNARIGAQALMQSRMWATWREMFAKTFAAAKSNAALTNTTRIIVPPRVDAGFTTRCRLPLEVANIMNVSFNARPAHKTTNARIGDTVRAQGSVSINPLATMTRAAALKPSTVVPFTVDFAIT